MASKAGTQSSTQGRQAGTQGRHPTQAGKAGRHPRPTLSVSKVFSHARMTKQSLTESTTISSTPLPLNSAALAMYPVAPKMVMLS